MWPTTQNSQLACYSFFAVGISWGFFSFPSHFCNDFKLLTYYPSTSTGCLVAQSNGLSVCLPSKTECHPGLGLWTSRVVCTIVMILVRLSITWHELLFRQIFVFYSAAVVKSFLVSIASGWLSQKRINTDRKTASEYQTMKYNWESVSLMKNTLTTIVHKSMPFYYGWVII